MLLSAFKRRWPVLTTLVAALLYIVNNYDIRGLDGLHLQPRAPSMVPGPGGYGNSGPAWTPSMPGGPALPSTQAPAGWPSSTSGAGMNGGGLNGVGPSGVGMSGSSVGYSAAYPSTSAGPSPFIAQGNLGPGASSSPSTSAASQSWEKLLTVGEKLGMLQNSQASAAGPTAGSRAAHYSPAHNSAGQAGATGLPDAIRIASFNLNGWGDAQRQDIFVSEMLGRLLSQFDIVALQDIRSRRDDVLPELMAQLNSTGRKFDFMVGPRVGRGDRREQLAFIFDTERIETDRFQLYTVEDPSDMLQREPLVGWFRAKNAAAQDAFTFSLVNVHSDSELALLELQTLPNLVQAIVNDGRGEDDIILAGDFGAPVQASPLFSQSEFRTVLDGVATTTRGTQLLDNFAFSQSSTAEFTGRAGAVDFLRQYNLSLEQATRVSEHLPIWAEFSIIEGGRPGQVAGTVLPERRFQGGVN